MIIEFPDDIRPIVKMEEINPENLAKLGPLKGP
jgi:hypothetical protein